MEPTNARALANLVVATDLMTVDLCLSACSDMMFAGIEFARYVNWEFKGCNC